MIAKCAQTEPQQDSRGGKANGWRRAQVPLSEYPLCSQTEIPRSRACGDEASRAIAIGKMTTFRENIVRVAAVALGLPLAYAGCAARQEPMPKYGPPFVTMRTKFDYSEHESYAKPGENGIRGQAFLRQEGDSVTTCRGNRVLLLPATSYFREMFWHMIAARSEPNPPETPYPSLKNMIRRTECDAQGNFSFSEIPDGTWFVLTQVNAKPDRMLITEMTLSNGETTEVLLTDRHIVGR